MTLDALQGPAMMFTLLAAWFVASRSERRRRWGFWIYLVSNVAWVGWGVQAGCPSGSVRMTSRSKPQTPAPSNGRPPIAIKRSSAASRARCGSFSSAVRIAGITAFWPIIERTDMLFCREGNSWSCSGYGSRRRITTPASDAQLCRRVWVEQVSPIRFLISETAFAWHRPRVSA